MQMNIFRVGRHYESASIQACLRTRISLRPLVTRGLSNGMRSVSDIALIHFTSARLPVDLPSTCLKSTAFGVTLVVQRW